MDIQYEEESDENDDYFKMKNQLLELFSLRRKLLKCLKEGKPGRRGQTKIKIRERTVTKIRQAIWINSSGKTKNINLKTLIKKNKT